AQNPLAGAARHDRGEDDECHGHRSAVPDEKLAETVRRAVWPRLDGASLTISLHVQRERGRRTISSLLLLLECRQRDQIEIAADASSRRRRRSRRGWRWHDLTHDALDLARRLPTQIVRTLAAEQLV